MDPLQAKLNMFAAPMENTDWQDEQLSWKASCYIHAGLSISGTFRVTGSDAKRMFSEMVVNDLDRLEVGASTHIVMCSDRGRIWGHGMLLREDDGQYLAIVHPMHVKYPQSSGRYDVSVEDLTGTRFIYQVAGPTSLEVLEEALEESLRDIRFLRHRPARAAGADVNVIRLGMAGTLAYEVHGDLADAEPVYDAILAAGAPRGIRHLGQLTYVNALHSETGFPNEYTHFWPAFADDPGMAAFLQETGMLFEPRLRGSLGPRLEDRFVTPYDVGWGHLVRFNHDFRGRSALERVADAPPRRPVTLVWDAEDVLDTMRSLFEPGDAHQLMRLPADNRMQGGIPTLYTDQVLAGDTLVGSSMGRMYSWHYRAMLSVAALDVEHATEGRELTVLWGDPGTRQKPIRATVARYPYLDLERNESIDVAAIA